MKKAWCRIFHQWAWIPKTMYPYVNPVYGYRCWWCLEYHAPERRGYVLGYDSGGNPFYIPL